MYTWKDFLKLGEATSDAELKGRMDAQKPGHCCTLIYTSGTTGNPKGVMISHDNAVWTAKSNVLHNKAITAGPLRVVSYLPLSHIAAQIVDIHSPLLCIVDFKKPAAVHFGLVRMPSRGRSRIRSSRPSRLCSSPCPACGKR